MSTAFRAVPVTENVWWVGAIDWALRNFHGYWTGRGTTYNAFLVRGEKTVLIDTVKRPFFPEMLSRIRSVIDPEQIDVVVSNHSEMDHSGALIETYQALKPEKVLASKAGVAALHAHFRPDFALTAVADGETLDIGGDTLTFVETKMLHWPDSMVTYAARDAVLFTQDAFGMHLASSERFADEVPRHIVDYEASKYFGNIVMPFAPIVLKALARLADLNLGTKVIAPDHGPIWRTPEDIQHILDCYAGWCKPRKSRKAVVIYDTMWHSTQQMANAVADGLAEGGATATVQPISGCHRSDIATELIDAGALLVGSPTLNNNMYPSVADVLCYLASLAPKGLIGAAFGSYGWSGQAAKQVAERLTEMKVELVADPLRVQWVPDEDALAACRELGRTVAERLVAEVEG